MNMPVIDRRSFLRNASLTAGVGAAAAAVPTLAPADEVGATSWRDAPDPIDPALITASYEADFVIVGGGYAGTFAAHTLSEAGADVILIEAQEGESYLSTAKDFGHLNSQYLLNQGVPEVDPLDFFNNWMLQTLNIANPELIMKFANQSGEALDWYLSFLDDAWIEEHVAVDYWPSNEYLVHEVNGQKFWNGTAQFDSATTMSEAQKVHHRAIEAEGGTIHFETHAEQLLKDGDRVTGVVATNAEGAYVQYNAAKAVVLATGDFGNNAEMREELLVHVADSVDSPDDWYSTGRSGDGHKMGVWAGGRLEPRPLPEMEIPNVPFAPWMPMNALWLNHQGKRFTNEFFGDMAWIHRAIANTHHDAVYTVCDSLVTEQIYNIPSHCRLDPTEEASVAALKDFMAQTVEAGADGVERQMGNYSYTWYAADDLKTLASYVGLGEEETENMLAAIERYNALCEAGRDDDFGKDERFLFPVNTPPYFMSRHTLSNVGGVGVTVGGFLTTGDQQVLDHNYDPIPGLFASGNTCGRRFGYNYFTPIAGVSVGMACTLGRVLGKYLLTL